MFEQRAAEASVNDIVGVWTLVRWCRSGGKSRFPFGEDAREMLQYSASGYMSAQLMRADWKAVGTAAAVGFLAYAGRWRLEGNSVLHEVALASLPGWVDTTLTREVTFLPNGELSLLTPWHNGATSRTQDRLIWARAERDNPQPGVLP